MDSEAYLRLLNFLKILELDLSKQGTVKNKSMRELLNIIIPDH
jgi:hypothetical protein